jgi:protein-arginine kinase activator protein McsA
MNNTTKAIFLLGAVALAFVYLSEETSETAPTENVKNLQTKLNEAVENEDFEKACLLRDKINSIQKA